jgi:hypothetical protein
MTLRYISGASIVTLLSSGLLAVAPAQAQDGSLLPPGESGVITVTGCLARSDKGDKFLLTSPRLGPVASVTTGACDAPINSRSLDLDDADDRGINGSLLGRWIEISGRLEKENSTDPNNLRELSVRSFRLVPVVPPQRVEAAPAPAAIPRLEPPAPEPAPVATTTIAEPLPVATTAIAEPTAEEPLPRTASPLAMVGLFGLLSLAGGLGFRFYRARR